MSSTARLAYDPKHGPPAFLNAMRNTRPRSNCRNCGAPYERLRVCSYCGSDHDAL